MPCRLEEAFKTSHNNMVGGFNSVKGVRSDAFDNGADLISGISSLESLKNPGFSNSEGNINQLGSGLPNRPSLDTPYMSDYTTNDRSDLETIATTCSPKPYNKHTGAPVASNCDDYMNHIWSCSSCRHKLRDLLSDSSDDNRQMMTASLSDSFKSFSLPKFNKSSDYSNTLHMILMGLGLIIIIDLLIRLRK